MGPVRMNTTSASTPCFEKNPCSCAIQSGVCRGLMPAKEMAIFGPARAAAISNPTANGRKTGVKKIANKLPIEGAIIPPSSYLPPKILLIETSSPKELHSQQSHGVTSENLLLVDLRPPLYLFDHRHG